MYDKNCAPASSVEQNVFDVPNMLLNIESQVAGILRGFSRMMDHLLKLLVLATETDKYSYYCKSLGMITLLLAAVFYVGYCRTAWTKSELRNCVFKLL